MRFVHQLLSRESLVCQCHQWKRESSLLSFAEPWENCWDLHRNRHHHHPCHQRYHFRPNVKRKREREREREREKINNKNKIIRKSLTSLNLFLLGEESSEPASSSSSSSSLFLVTVLPLVTFGEAAAVLDAVEVDAGGGGTALAVAVTLLEEVDLELKKLNLFGPPPLLVAGEDCGGVEGGGGGGGGIAPPNFPSAARSSFGDNMENSHQKQKQSAKHCGCSL
jgi:hypothetical protein